MTSYTIIVTIAPRPLPLLREFESVWNMYYNFDQFFYVYWHGKVFSMHAVHVHAA